MSADIKEHFSESLLNHEVFKYYTLTLSVVIDILGRPTRFTWRQRRAVFREEGVEVECPVVLDSLHHRSNIGSVS